MDAQWQRDDERERALEEALGSSGGQAFWSIRLGGYAVLAGSEQGLSHITRELPEVELGRHRYPFRLAQHGPYHTPLAQPVSERAAATLPDLDWRRPEIPLVDGRGVTWSPWSADPDLLREYTLGAQVTSPYDFSASVRVALREYAPEFVLLPGPGNSLGGAVGQILCREGWRGIRSKQDFQRAVTSESPPLVSMDA